MFALQFAVGGALADAAFSRYSFQGFHLPDSFGFSQLRYLGSDAGPLRLGSGLNRCRRQKQHNLPANTWPSGQLGSQFADRATQELLVQLGQLSRHDYMLRRAEDGLDVREGIENAVGSLVEQVRRLASFQFFQSRLSLASFCREKAVEGERLGGEAAGDQSADGGVRPGNREDIDAGGNGDGGDLSPGSAIPGVPASLTTAMRPPSFNSATSSSEREPSLCMW